MNLYSLFTPVAEGEYLTPLLSKTVTRHDFALDQSRPHSPIQFPKGPVYFIHTVHDLTINILPNNALRDVLYVR